VTSFVDLVLGVSRRLSVTVLDGAAVMSNPILAVFLVGHRSCRRERDGCVPRARGSTVSSDAANAYVSVRALSPARVLLTPASATAAVDDTLLFTAQVLDYAASQSPALPSPSVLTLRCCR
jgi:hypothetical protein